MARRDAVTYSYYNVLFCGGPLNAEIVDTITMYNDSLVWSAPNYHHEESTRIWAAFDGVDIPCLLFDIVQYHIERLEIIPDYWYILVGQIRGHPNNEAMPLVIKLCALMAAWCGGLQRGARTCLSEGPVNQW